MLLDIVWIILRETLEASLLITVLLTIATRENVSLVWFVIAGVLGFFGSWLYANNLQVVSQWFDYIGQEVVNGLLQYSIYFFMLLMAITLHLYNRRVISARANHAVLFASMVLATAFALIREGSEIFIFYQGLAGNSDSMTVAVTSGLLGCLIGLCVGALIYYLVFALPVKAKRHVQFCLLMLVASGMVLQATQQFIQADLFTASVPVWNSNDFIPEESILGQLLYAMLGYESTPSSIEFGLYLLSITTFILLPYVAKTLLEYRANSGQKAI